VHCQTIARNIISAVDNLTLNYKFVTVITNFSVTKPNEPGLCGFPSVFSPLVPREKLYALQKFQLLLAFLIFIKYDYIPQCSLERVVLNDCITKGTRNW